MSLSSCSSPSAPEPHNDGSELQPVAPPSAPASSPNAAENAPITTELGSLHLTPCSLDEYFDIDTARFGKYEYVEGMLVALPTADEEHDKIAKYLLNHGKLRFVRGQSKHSPGLQESMAIPRSPSSPRRHHKRENVRRPDVSVAAPLSPSAEANLSPVSSRISNPVPGMVKIVVEITSVYEETDILAKKKEYEKAEIDILVTVVRDMKCKDESKRDKHVRVNRRDPSSNCWGPDEVYRGDAPVDMGPLGTHTPSTLFGNLDPDSPLKNLAKEMQRKDLDKLEAERREQEARKQEQETKKKHAEEMKRKDAEIEALKKKHAKDMKQKDLVIEEGRKRGRVLRDRKNYYKSVVKTNLPGEVLSSSSSSPGSSRGSSPTKKKHKAH